MCYTRDNLIFDSRNISGIKIALHVTRGCIMFRKIISLLLTSGMCIAAASCSVLPGSKVTIPELVSITDFAEDDEGYIEVRLICFDGEKATIYDSDVKFKDRDQYLKDKDRLNRIVKKTVSRKGTPAPDFTPDDIKYPVYSFMVEPRKIGEDFEYGENIVWTNGYLITDSGDAYKCNMDFSSITGSEDLFRIQEHDDANALKWSCFRPLAMANGEWNTDLLSPVEPERVKTAPVVKGKAVNRYQKNGYDWVSIEFENWSDKDWDFSNSYVIDVRVEGQLYSIPRDACRNSYEIGVMSYQNLVLKSTKTTKDYCLSVYGDLVPGDYVISVFAKCGGEDCVILVDYTI